MIRGQVKAVGDALMVMLPKEVQESFELKDGDELDFVPSENSFILRSIAEAERELEFASVAKEVFERRDYVLRRLAEGAR